MMLRHGDYAEQLNDVSAKLICTSPPYNIGSKQSRKDGRRKFGEYDPKSYGGITGYDDNLPWPEYQESQRKFLIWAADHLTKDGTLVYNHKPRRVDGAMIHPAQWFLHPDVITRLTLMEEVVWDRGSTHNHCLQLMWPQTERLYVFRRADGVYSFQSTPDMPQRSDVWKISLSSRKTTEVGHNAPWPDALADAIVAAWSAPGDLVCDPYAGSGAAGMAALRLGRFFVGSELNEEYHRVAAQRLEDFDRVAAPGRTAWLKWLDDQGAAKAGAEEMEAIL
jgi:hypothetical protein